MPKINQQIKQTILDDLKLNSLSVAQGSKKYQISPKTIYNWLQQSSPEAELRLLKRRLKESEADNQALYRLVKRLSGDLKKKI